MAIKKSDMVHKPAGGRWLGKKQRTAEIPEGEMSESERITQWVNEARAEINKNAAGAHASKPLFRAKDQAYSTGDKILFTSGITLSLICAFFPWYVFLNQDQFGVPTVQLGDIPASGRPAANEIRAQRDENSLPEESLAGRLKLDEFTTGTLPDKNDPHEPDAENSSPPREQPFPTMELPFSLVHVANGRAMFEDESGLFVVQRDSILPDSSRVISIEKRGSNWVVVTSTGRVIETSK